MADDEDRYRDLPEDDFAGLPDEEDDLSEGASTGDGEDESEAEEAPKAKKGKAKPAKEEKKKKKLSKKRKATSFIDAEAADEARALFTAAGGKKGGAAARWGGRFVLELCRARAGSPARRPRRAHAAADRCTSQQGWRRRDRRAGARGRRPRGRAARRVLLPPPPSFWALPRRHLPSLSLAPFPSPPSLPRANRWRVRVRRRGC